jgi:hypothetical protein
MPQIGRNTWKAKIWFNMKGCEKMKATSEARQKLPTTNYMHTKY